jgi:heme O synthase-like polyprenyltransferase
MILFLSILNFVNFDVRSGSFIQSSVGIPEPVGTLVGLFVSILLIGIALNFTWNIALKKVVKIYIVSIIAIALLPVILILFHIGEL